MIHVARTLIPIALLSAACGLLPAAPEEPVTPGWRAGAAVVDITPSYPVRLSGYAARKTESEGVAQPIYAKALALRWGTGKPALLVTVDNCGVPGAVRDELAQRLSSKRGLEAPRLSVCSTHTHSAPCLSGYLPNLFNPPPTPEQIERIEKYTTGLIDSLETISLKALDGLQPARLSWSQGTAGFAANRRTPGGPVDHDLPTLFVASPGGNLVALFASYACHCTTMVGESNVICGDWAGFAQESLQKAYPKAVAMIGIGCAGDANPNPRPGIELARRHGEELAAEVKKLWAGPRTGVSGELVCLAKSLELSFDSSRTPDRAEWEARARTNNHYGLQAKRNLEKLDRGGKIPDSLTYQVQTWRFGDNLALVFLPGEVVVDYALRLKHELDAKRLWVVAYANDVPCYIPSERILKEGGYEGGGAMVYYDRPAPFAPGLENTIVNAAKALLPDTFHVPERKP